MVGKKGAYDGTMAESARAALLRFRREHGRKGRLLPDGETGKKLGTSSATINKVSNGDQQMQMPLAIALCKELRCTLDDLMHREGIPRDEEAEAARLAPHVARLLEEKPSHITSIPRK